MRIYGDIHGYFKELYASRTILKSLIIKNLVGRYKYSLLGFSWNFIMPLMMLFVYYVVFTQIRSMDIPYFWIFISSALFPFNFLISNFIGGAGCIVNNSGIVKKMYFPREIIVISQVLSNFVVLLMGYLIVVVAIILSEYNLTWAIVYFPLLLLLMVIFSIGSALLTSSLTVYVRDVQYFLNSINMIFFFITPMYFVVDSINGLFGAIIWLNPFTYFVESFHQMVYFGEAPSLLLLEICTIISFLLLFVGVVVFNKLKSGFAERL